VADEQKASFKIDLETNTADVSAEAAAEMENLRQKIGAGGDAIKQMSSALRALRGNTDEVKDAKKQLQAKIDAMKDSVSGANLVLLKQGTTYEKLAGQARKLADQQKKLEEASKLEAMKKSKADADAMGNALKVTGGPVESLRGRFEQLTKVVSGDGGAMGALTLIGAGLVAALAALAVAAVAVVATFVKFVIVGADAARSMNLMREAATGSAQNAHNLGTQVDALSGKVSTSKEKLNELAVALARTRLSGSAQVDTLNAVGQAAAAMGDDVGNTLKGIITRGQIARRIQINPLELQGTGLKFQDVAAALATQMKVGVKEAQQALFEGRVKLDDGAKALRTAVEKRFGEINARKLLSLDVQLEKFKERLGSLTADVKLEPLLKGVDELAKLFDESTVSGATLKELVTIVGNGIGPAFQAVVPIAKGFMQGLIIAGLDVAIAFLKVKNSITKTFGGGDLLRGIDVAKLALVSAKTAIYSFAAGLAAIAAVGAIIGVAIIGSIAAIKLLVKGVTGAWDTIKNIDWGQLGISIVQGLVEGLKSGASLVIGAVTGLADKVKGAFTGALEIHSPSKFGDRSGFQLPAGVAVGVRRGTPDAAAAVDDMALSMKGAGGLSAETPSTSAGGVAQGRGGINLGGLNISIQANAGATDIQAKVSDPSFIAQLTDAIERVLQAAGIPTQTVPTS
jgi:hypothetical protein